MIQFTLDIKDINAKPKYNVIQKIIDKVKNIPYKFKFISYEFF